MADKDPRIAELLDAPPPPPPGELGQEAESTAEPLDDAQLEQLWEAAKSSDDQKKGKPPPDRSARLVKVPRSSLKLWSSTKIWVQNASGKDVIVFVHRFNTIKELVEMGGTVSGGPTGGSLQGQLKYAEKQGRVQIEDIDASDGEQVLFELGAGAKGSYVTVAQKDDLGQLYCKDRTVNCGWCLRVLTGTIPDTVLTAPAAK